MEALRLLFLFLLGPTVALALTHKLPSLKPGLSLSVEKEGQLLVSQEGSFSSGFYRVGTNVYCYAIWFTNSAEKTVVWMANRDRPVNGKGSRLTLHRNGNLVLTDADGSIVWSTDTFSDGEVEVQLLETGNLVLINQAKEVIWESFDFPTDTLLPTQPLTRNTSLFSMRSRDTFRLDFIALNNMGRFRSSDNLKFNASDYGVGPKRRLTLDYDGILRLYSLDELTGIWEIAWLPSGVDACLVHGLCGEYGVCRYNPLPSCACPDGFDRNDPSDWTKGCSPSFNMSCAPAELGFMELLHTDYFGYDLNSYNIGISLEACKNACLNDCTCKGFGYALDGQGQCYPKRYLLNGYHMPDTAMIMHIKVPKVIMASQAGGEKLRTYDQLNCSTPEIVLRNINAGWWFVFRKRIREELVNMGYIVLAMGFKHFTFGELKRATRNFREEIGRGGFGTVYKGVLDDKRIVAVKRLEGIILQGDSEFWAEVSIIGKINHRNLVKMWGFCTENDHKLLVYEYLENGSLDKILFSADSAMRLGWEQRYNIAIGTAKGLSYLHEECLEWVLHCDVKPQNILLDDHLEPKVTDFGLSKLFKDTNDMGFSRVRGTRGYLAPEWMINLRINAKADVYSYGVVLLELLTGKRASGFNLATAEGSGHNQMVQWFRLKIQEQELEEVIDPRLEKRCHKKEVQRMVRVALLCVEDDRDTRPAMSKVVELLVGEEELVPNEEMTD
ncbi:putative receptor protein kinase ZmPK1 [Vitis vinifera]|uniref:Receptor-like serine/threonine-protein kinase n=1 Tax=Vitis vinifera TaxID=29760 RepID=A0A438KNQ7_VITVI|nr:putative receptor protein kinase ZmPK1 [Vitis vinifera]